MGLEVATYINGLDATFPLATDAGSQGDDHMRLLKSTLKATFPNLTGAMTATHTELSYMVGVTGGVQGQLNAKAAIAGQVWTGVHDYTGATLRSATPAVGDSSTQVATTAFVASTAFASALPALPGNNGKVPFLQAGVVGWSLIGTAGQLLRVNLAGTAIEGYTVVPDAHATAVKAQLAYLFNGGL